MNLGIRLATNQGSSTEHYRTAGERVADGAAHAIGLVLIALGGGALMAAAVRHSSDENAYAMALYIVCAILMLSCSAAYNLASPIRARRVLCWLDGTAIFVMIAGSYTPLFLNLSRPNFFQ